MSYSERKYNRPLSFGQRSNALILLISINLVIFVILAFVRAIFFMRYENNVEADSLFQSQVLKWFVLPADIHEIGTRPWTIITHMFTHSDVWHVLGKYVVAMGFWLHLTRPHGNRKIFPVFLYGAFGGAIAYVLAINFLPALEKNLPYAVALGASAGVMAIAVAATTITPGYRIFPMLNGGIPIWIITAFYLIIDLANIPDSNRRGTMQHLGGGLTGFLFIVSFRRGYDWGGWMNSAYDWVNDLFNPDKPKKGKSAKEQLFYKSSGKPFKRTPNLTEKRIDEILDKINEDGYDSLSDEEKELLKKASKEDF